MGGYSGAPVHAVLSLAPTVSIVLVQAALAEWLEKAHGVPLETASYDNLIVEWRVSEGEAFACQLVVSDSSHQVRRTVTAFSDDSGTAATIDETPLAAADAPRAIVDLSEGIRLLLSTLLPISKIVMNFDRQEPADFAAIDSKELLSTLTGELTPGIVALRS